MTRRKWRLFLLEVRVLGAVLTLAAVSVVPLALAAAHSELAPDGRASVLLTLGGRGVQVYTCAGTEAGPRWLPAGPEADLVDAAGRVVGAHRAGPSWTLADGSRIVGTVSARVDAPVPGAVPWLLLRAASVGGPGALHAVTHVQRVHTSGGAAPVTGCRRATEGTTVRVPYAAEYVFFGPRDAVVREEALSRR